MEQPKLEGQSDFLSGIDTEGIEKEGTREAIIKKIELENSPKIVELEAESESYRENGGQWYLGGMDENGEYSDGIMPETEMDESSRRSRIMHFKDQIENSRTGDFELFLDQIDHEIKNLQYEISKEESHHKEFIANNKSWLGATEHLDENSNKRIQAISKRIEHKKELIDQIRQFQEGK